MMRLLQRLINRWTKTTEPDPMKYLIVGLGNMGAEYDDTRHNIGFEAVDAMAKELEVSFKNDQLGDLAQGKYRGRTILLLKPSTYMNRSGKAVNYWMQKARIQPENLLVIVDDLNIDFGKLRLRTKGSDGGHNGLKDINQTIGGKYARLRVGIGNNYHKGQQINFVLGKWSSEENDKLPEIRKRCVEAIQQFSTIGAARTMNAVNG